jgi:hypothetical protein
MTAARRKAVYQHAGHASVPEYNELTKNKSAGSAMNATESSIFRGSFA